MSQIKCGTDLRRQQVRESEFNGINYLEVYINKSNGNINHALILVHCFKTVVGSLDKKNVQIVGGVRISGIMVEWASDAFTILTKKPSSIIKDLTRQESDIIFGLSSDAENVLVIRPNTIGDFSTYALQLVSGDTSTPQSPPNKFDPILSSVDFSFKVDCPSDFDCAKEKPPCLPQVNFSEPVIDYMAKDYASFRKLMLDRLSMLIPDWQERNPADMGIALVELFAYVGDQLSYYQDAVATEAYLGTARKRVSLRRHVRLVDYQINEGCNSRAWMLLSVDKDIPVLPQGTKILSGDVTDVVYEDDVAEKISSGSECFETMYPVSLFSANNEILFYTWGELQCCLPKGATSATLLSANADDIQSGKSEPSLNIGDVIIFEEIRSPTTGIKSDRNINHVHAVRITSLTKKTDDLYGTKILEISWSIEDALPFPICINQIFDPEEQKEGPVSIIHGNVVLADDGYTVSGDKIGTVPESGRFRPSLSKKPLTFAVPYDQSQSASSSFNFNSRQAIPCIAYMEDGDKNKWLPSPAGDLLESNEFDRYFVVEMEDDQTAFIRFGDSMYGAMPTNSTTQTPNDFTATYRIGNGKKGNVGRDTMTSIVTPAIQKAADGIQFTEIDVSGVRVRNPMPARGGTDPETMDEIRQNAPWAFQTQQRAVTENDYEEILLRHKEVVKASAQIRWTGSWYTVFIAIERMGGKLVDLDFKSEIRSFLDSYRLTGYDLEITDPIYVPLHIEMNLCILPGYPRSEIRQILIDEFSNRDLGNGKYGFFYPDNFSFGKTVFLSQIYERATTIQGVCSVRVTTFQRWAKSSNGELDAGKIQMGQSEIARLGNDPNFPENGKIVFNLEGGI